MTKGQKENDKSNTNKIFRSKNKKQNLVSTIFHDFSYCFQQIRSNLYNLKFSE